MGHTGPRRRTAVAVLLLLGGVALVPALPPLAAGAAVATNRISGADRYATAAAMAKAKFPNGTGAVVVASGATFADALAGAYFAGLNTPACPLQSAILLTAPTALPGATLQALSDLKAKFVVILGGVSAVSAGVESQLKGTASTSSAGGNLSVSRASGASRYDTMYQLNVACGVDSVGLVSGKRTAFVASGANFPDALAAAGAAYGKHLPMVLTAPDQLSAQARQALADLKIEQVLILGGAGAVKPAVNSAIQSMGIAIASQFAGTDRLDTASQVATYEVANLGFSNSEIAIARGTDFADALAGAQYTGDPKPTLLTQDATHVGAATGKYASDNKGQIATVTALGGTASVSEGSQHLLAMVANGFTLTGLTPTTIARDGAFHDVVVTGTAFPSDPEEITVIVLPSQDNPNPPCTAGRAALESLVRTSDTEVRGRIRIPDGCPAGSWDLLMLGAKEAEGDRTLGVAGVTHALTVQLSPMTVTAITPASVKRDGATKQVTIAGTGFVPQSKASISPAANNTNASSGACGTSAHAIDVTATTVKSDKEITGSLVIPAGCPSGAWDVLVDNSAVARGDLAVCTGCLTVTGDAPPPAGRFVTLSTTTPKVGDTVTVTYGGGVNPDAEDQITARTSTTCIGNCPPPGQNGNNPGVSGSFSFTVPAEGAGDVHQVIWQYVVADERANPGPGCDSHSCTRNFSVEV